MREGSFLMLDKVSAQTVRTERLGTADAQVCARFNLTFNLT